MLGLKRRENPARERRLQPGEEERLRAAAPEWLKHFISLAIETCCRRSELASLVWSDVDLQRRVLTLRDTKNNDKGVKVPLSTRAIAALSALNPTRYREGEALLGCTGIRSGTRSRWPAGRRGFEGLRLHDLRAEGVSRLFERGLDR